MTAANGSFLVRVTLEDGPRIGSSRGTLRFSVLENESRKSSVRGLKMAILLKLVNRTSLLPVRFLVIFCRSYSVKISVA